MSLLSRLAVQAARAYGILSAADKTKVVADYLVVAGGGGAGDNLGGGGGAGGLLTSTTTLSTLNTYSITVGAGGVGGASGDVNGSNGSNSVISGTGLTTITAIGGGGGAGNSAANSGGSGGGGSSSSGSTGGAGTSGQGYAGGTTPSGTYWQAASGGGGAGAAGTGRSASASTGGNGGNGIQSSISGTATYYAGGGAGGAGTGFGTGTVGTAGLGGGGIGKLGDAGGKGGNGGVNLGGGGGGGGTAGGDGGDGGSGIVIISYTSATPKFVGGTITTSGGKQIHTFTSSGTLSPLTPITASYLVVAGGGGGAGADGGGGGAGGLLTSSTTLYSGATYVVTVGAGGSGGSAAGSAATSGSSSVLSGTGLTTLTATGGGNGGGAAGAAGGSGGSGGGGSGGGTPSGAGGSGTSGQGNNGGSGSTNSGAGSGGGGGGAGAVGSNGTTSSGSGGGGVGLSSSISGTATYYAGGGGGGCYSGFTPGSGGNGGGGSGGASNTGPGVTGTTNTGGGGGGGGSTAGVGNAAGAAGGSGIVIISYAGSQQFNGGLVTTSGGNTIHTFTSTGALTPLTNNLNNSLRFRSSASANLSKTFSTGGTSRQIQTCSLWVKRGTLGSTYSYMIGAYDGSSGFDAGIQFLSDNLCVQVGGVSSTLTTTQVFRDPSAWYHIVVAIDTTQATAANRVKVYVNGNQVTAFSTATYPTQNANINFLYANSNNRIGTNWNNNASTYFDGYMTDINFIDGQALEPYYFGNNDANGVWKPIQYKGTYGTNGFYLTFGNTTSTTTLGYDSSPNGNNWTCNNISLTAGTTYDAMTDVPTNTSATVANYCVKNPLVASTGATITGANLNSTGSTTTFANARGTFTLTSGKWYWEETITGSSIYDIGVGLVLESSVKSASNTRQTGWYNICNASAGQVASTTNGGGFVNISTTDFATNDVIMVAYDADTGYIWFGKNGTWYPPTTGGSAGNPAAGTNQTITAVSGLIPSSFHYNTNAGTASNFGQRAFSYTPPTGYVALNTYNLPTPTILQGNKYMDATLWTGTATTQVVVNNSQFKPDFVWMKSRSGTYNHWLFDSNRGTGKLLASNLTDAESNYPNILSAFNSNGFTTNSNGATDNFVGWQWQAGQGSTSSNTNGSITSTVSVNTTAGFSVATWTAPSSGNWTIGHGLGVAPSFVITKSRSAGGWIIYHSALGNTKWLEFTTAAAQTGTSFPFNSVSPTSTLITYGNATSWGASANFVTYSWAEIAGFSKFGSYTGNGSTDGPFVYLGFRPKWIMVKSSSYSAADTHWHMLDTSRNTANPEDKFLNANTSGAEDTYTFFDILSNGFKLRQNGASFNGSGTTYIYAAFAEHPAKISNAR